MISHFKKKKKEKKKASSKWDSREAIVYADYTKDQVLLANIFA